MLVNDNNFTYNINANQLFGIDYVYRKITPDGGPKETTNAYAFYYRQALTAKTAFALRFSGAQDKTDGYTVFTPVVVTDDTLKKSLAGFTSNDISSVTARPYDITATYEIKAAANFLTRLSTAMTTATSRHLWGKLQRSRQHGLEKRPGHVKPVWRVHVLGEPYRHWKCRSTIE